MSKALVTFFSAGGVTAKLAARLAEAIDALDLGHNEIIDQGDPNIVKFILILIFR